MTARNTKVGDEKSVKDRNRDLQNQQANLDLALRDIMATGQGRFWIWNLLSAAHVFGEVVDWTPEVGTRITDFNLGEQNVGKRVLAQIARVCPDSYVQAMKEASDE